jgi:hypothetical protein
MKVRLLRDARITMKEGDIVEVSPSVGAFLLSIGSAVEEKPKKTTTKK